MAAETKTATILLAEPQQAMRQIVKSGIRGILGGDAVNFIDAEDGASALVALEAHGKPVDIALVDWEMVPMDGACFLHALRNVRDYQAHRTTPVIVITGHASPEVMNAALRLGANSFMPKPVAPATVAARINALLTGKTEFVMVEGGLGNNQPFVGPLSKWSFEQFVQPARADNRRVFKL